MHTSNFLCQYHITYDDQEGWATALQTLELSLDEVVHIRSVLTKAELENLPLDGTLKEDMEKGKVRNISGNALFRSTIFQKFLL